MFLGDTCFEILKGRLLWFTARETVTGRQVYPNCVATSDAESAPLFFRHFNFKALTSANGRSTLQDVKISCEWYDLIVAETAVEMRDFGLALEDWPENEEVDG